MASAPRCAPFSTAARRTRRPIPATRRGGRSFPPIPFPPACGGARRICGSPPAPMSCIIRCATPRSSAPWSSSRTAFRAPGTRGRRRWTARTCCAKPASPPATRELRALILAGDCWRRWPLYGRPALAHWSQGAVTLLGDAAHPMLPFLAQGAAMAIEDAEALGRAFPPGVAPAEAFKAYERARIARATKVQRASRRQGDHYHASGLHRVGARPRDLGARRAKDAVPQRLAVSLKSRFALDRIVRIQRPRHFAPRRDRNCLCLATGLPSLRGGRRNDF